MEKKTTPTTLLPDATAVIAALAERGISALTAADLDKYASMVLEANARFNLTAHRDLPAVLSLLFYDSLAPYDPSLFEGSKKVLDVGSGAGVPGLLLALAFPGLAVSIIEANAKKCSFISAAANALHLPRVEVLCQRAEQLVEEQREQYDLVTARAVAALPVLLELLAPYARVGGLVVCPKSRRLAEELDASVTAARMLGLSLLRVDDFVSKTGTAHCVAVFKKVSKTDSSFPRRWAQIVSKPL